ncbi:MAG TPA: hypothetical protein VFB61_01130 [Gemmatimonadales bacterium]|nr:hypothetical protein [Gemmatimonadales bacterium]
MSHTLIDVMTPLLLIGAAAFAAVLLTGGGIRITAKVPVRAQRNDNTSHLNRPRTRRENNHG